MVQENNYILPQYNPSHHRHSSSSPSPSSSASFSSSQSTLVSPTTTPSLSSSARMYSTTTATHKETMLNNDDEDNQHHHLLHHPISSPAPSSPSPSPTSRPWISRHRSAMTTSRTILLVLVFFMMMTLIRLHNLHPPSTGKDMINVTSSTEPQPPSQITSNTSLHSPPISENDNNTNVSTKDSKNKNTNDVFSDPTVQSVTETALTRTVQYVDGRVVKTYKPQFWNQPEQAKKELGSFLETLSKRSQQAVEARVLNVMASAMAAGSDDAGIDALFGTLQEDDEGLRQERYFGFLPMGGGNNQFVNVQKAALLAKRTGRTLVLPPISPNTHIRAWDGRPYSEFYDIPTFIRLSGIKVVEWHEIKTVPSDGLDGYTLPKQYKSHWIDFSEDFPCQVTNNIGKDNTHLYDRFRNQYLLKFIESNGPEDETHGAATDFAYAETVLLKNNPQQPSSSSSKGPGNTAKTLKDLLAPLPRDELWQCLSSPYFLNMDHNTGPMLWSEVGVHLRFHPRLEAMADLLLRHVLLGTPLDSRQLLNPNLHLAITQKEGEKLPPFIIVHLRRGDIVSKCHGLTEEACLVQIESIAEQVAQFEKQRITKLTAKGQGDQYKPLPVLVTTNERRESELAKLDKLGWIRIDHGDPADASAKHEANSGGDSKAIQLGTESLLGPFYPSILDGILLTRGQYLIGMRNSKMSQLAVTRGREWYGHDAVLMEGGVKAKKASN